MKLAARNSSAPELQECFLCWHEPFRMLTKRVVDMEESEAVQEACDDIAELRTHSARHFFVCLCAELEGMDCDFEELQSHKADVPFR